MYKILTIIGTRPEAIKLAPVVLELRKHPGLVESRVCVTAQHRELLDNVLTWFGIVPDKDLNLMQEDQKLHEFAGRALAEITRAMEEFEPNLVLIQGDTTTVMVSALAAFYRGIPVGHVEAGLRTGDMANPFPEEMNRKIAGVLASFHFAPTERAAESLKAEQVPPERIFLTGNTVVDALLWTIKQPVDLDPALAFDPRRIILVTAHRRENFGAPLEAACKALRTIADRNEDVDIVYPVHPNPNVKGPVGRLLAGHPHIHLLEPLRYEEFCHLTARSYLILTDSGGLQEEATVLRKPVLVMRETTERPEALEAGAALLVGTSEERILEEAERLLNDKEAYGSMILDRSPFGDGHASERIVDAILNRFL